MKKKDAEDKRNTITEKGDEISRTKKPKKTSKRAHIVFDDAKVSDYEWDFDLVNDLDKTIKESISGKKSDLKKSGDDEAGTKEIPDREKSVHETPDTVADVQKPILIKKSDTYSKIASVEKKLPALPETTSHDIAPVESASQDSYVMPDEVIEKYTKYPLDDYYAAYYDTLRSGKKFRGFSWKAFLFGYYWGAFRLINEWIVFAMICVVALMTYSLYGITLDDTFVSKSMLNDLNHMNIDLFPFSKVIFEVFIVTSFLCLLFIGFIGDFIYAKYGVLYNKYKWMRTDKKYEAYSAWRVLGVIVVCKFLFWMSFIVSGAPNKWGIPLLVGSLFAVTLVLFGYLAYDFLMTDPRKLALQIGTKQDYIYASAIKSEKYFKNQFRKYENTKKCEFNWCAFFFHLPYIASKALYKVFFLISGIFSIAVFSEMMTSIAVMKMGVGYTVLLHVLVVVLIITCFVYIGLKFNAMYYKKIKALYAAGKEFKKTPRIIVSAIILMLLL